MGITFLRKCRFYPNNLRFPAAINTQEPVRENDRANINILVVDDDREIVRSLAKLLTGSIIGKKAYNGMGGNDIP